MRPTVFACAVFLTLAMTAYLREVGTVPSSFEVKSCIAYMGNTSSLRVTVISNPRAESVTFVCKAEPIVTAASEGVHDLWSSYQDWGSGGTSTSIFVPFRVRVAADGSIGRSPLPSDPKTWPEIPYVGSFPGVFVAAARERNADLMIYALEHLYDEDDLDWYGGYGLPPLEQLWSLVWIASCSRAIMPPVD